MDYADVVNGLFESFGGLLILLHVRRLLKDKRVRGVSLTAVAYMTVWGLWNLYYYPSLGQWTSFAGGIGVVAANTLWVGLALWYIWKERRG